MKQRQDIQLDVPAAVSQTEKGRQSVFDTQMPVFSMGWPFGKRADDKSVQRNVLSMYWPLT